MFREIDIHRLPHEMKVILVDCYNREINGINPSQYKFNEFHNELLIYGLVQIISFGYSNGIKAAYTLTEKGKNLVKKMENFAFNPH